MKKSFALPGQLYVESDEGQDYIVAPQVVEIVKIALQSFRLTPSEKVSWDSM